MDVTLSGPRPGVVRPVLPTTAGSGALAPTALAQVVLTRTVQASTGPVSVVPASTCLTQVVRALCGSASIAPGSRDRARS